MEYDVLYRFVHVMVALEQTYVHCARAIDVKQYQCFLLRLRYLFE